MANLNHQWLAYAKRLHALAESGLAFSPDEFDRERYEEISILARQMMADLANTKVEQISEIVTPYHRRYVTPQVEVRGAMFFEQKILLVQEKSDGKWTLPGGYADVGFSAVENIIKEVDEEAGLPVVSASLYAVRHKAMGNYDPDIREFYKLFFLCQSVEDPKPKAGMETQDAAFFDLNQLPPLSTGRTIERDIQDAFFFLNNPQAATIIE